MAQIQKGHTYNPGDVVDAPDLNAHVDAAIARVTGGLVSEQTAVAAVPADYVLISDTSDSNKLKKALVSSFGVGTVTGVGLSMPTPFFVATTPSPNPIVGSGTFTVTFRDQAAGKVLAGPVSGADTTPSFRVLVPSDVTDLVTVASTTINFDLGNTFYKSIVTPTLALDLTNGTPGQVIKVILIQNSAGHSTVTWNAPGSGVLRWPGGTPPVMSTGPVGTTDIYEFTLLKVSTGPNNYYGVRLGAAFDV